MRSVYAHIAVCKDDGLWHEKFAHALDAKLLKNYLLTYQIIDLERHDWIETVKSFDLIIWQPSYMGPRSAAHFKEKIYFIQNILHKLVLPNYNTIWHFESKVAQNYILKEFEIPIPKTIVTFSYIDAINELNQSAMPIVFKKSYGASSQNVQLISTREKARRLISSIFCQQLWNDIKKKHKQKFVCICVAFFNYWFWSKIWQKIWHGERTGVVYWQEFIPKNMADLRVTVIGDRYAYGFWRNNRPGDFRASGSGRIDYNRNISQDIILYCLKLNRIFGFDSMAYDIIFLDKKFLITELSYAYVDTAIFNAKGYYELDNDDQLKFHEKHTWPQELWIEWALRKIAKCKKIQ